MNQPEVEVARRRRSRPLAGRLRDSDDEYGLVLFAILATLIVMGILSDRSSGRAVVPVMLMGVLFLTMMVSAVPRRTILILTVVIPVVIVASGLSTASEIGSAVSSLSPLVSTGLVLASVYFIVRRLATHEVISRRTILGSLCVYLLGALLFAMVYIAIATLTGELFFVQTDTPSAIDYIYFSFITVATVGFGDLSPATDVGRMFVVVEAITGQLYLVVVVALFVSRIGRRRGGDLGGGAVRDERSDTEPPRPAE